jgi:hypothetical protein
MQDEPQSGFYSPSEAGRVLDLSKRRVLQLLERRELLGEKDAHGRWKIPAPHVYALKSRREETERQKPTPPGPLEENVHSRELVEALRDQISDLRHQLEEERESRRRADTIIVQLSQANAEQARTIRELPSAAPETSEDAAKPSERPDPIPTPSSTPPEPQTVSQGTHGNSTRPTLRGWLRRVINP